MRWELGQITLGLNFLICKMVTMLHDTTSDDYDQEEM